MNINWIQNNNQELINNVENMLDKDLILNRLAYILNTTVDGLLQQVQEEEIMYLIANILINRGITTQQKIDDCFNSISNSIQSPYIITNAEKAADKILEYLKNENATIYIFADYDADGLTAGYVFTAALREIANCKVVVKFPERVEGYGLNLSWCESIVKEHKDDSNVLVVTVDNGVTKVEEVKYLIDNGIDVIITDHHESDEKGIPNCIIVDPHNKYEEQDNRTKHLCGCGIAFKVAQIIQEKCDVYNMYNYIPYLAISTLTDVMPLTAENLSFIQYGLEIMNSDNCPPRLKVLFNKLGIEILTSEDILWTVGPLLNACGRMGNTALGAKLLFEDNAILDEDVIDIINDAIKLNDDRKKLTKKAKEEISKLNFDDNNVAIFATNKYPSGIIGIIAGKLMEQFNKPGIACNFISDNVVHGSVRSIPGVDMLSTLKQLEKNGLILSSGGHGAACVCSFEYDKLEDINKAFNELIELPKVEEEQEEPTKDMIIDEEITFGHLCKAVYAVVNLLPTDNKVLQSPIFKIKDLQVVSYKTSKSNPNNLCLTVKEGRKKKDIWAWGFADLYINELKCAKNISLVGKISKNFMGSGYVLNVEDILAS